MDMLSSISPIASWLKSSSKPIVIAGPCSAETEEQLYQTCLAISKMSVDAIRVGIWKPRTRPNQFEGVGSIGLAWINQIKKEINIPFAIEVATPAHVEEALKNNIDILWIGARTTVNPFNVQAIADSLKGVDIPVMVKNPVNPDLHLWMGAIERVYQAGITQIAAIHRGFSTFQKTKYRNIPLWQIPIELKTNFPNLPLICDPSHITGDRKLIQEVAQKALDLNYDGLMIETHITPDKAWSDAAQQVTPEHLMQILNNLHVKTSSSTNIEFVNQLEELRLQIDGLDRELLEILASRMQIIEKIGSYKKQNNVAILQLERWQEIFTTRPDWANKLHLNAEFIEELYKIIHTESIRKQTEIKG